MYYTMQIGISDGPNLPVVTHGPVSINTLTDSIGGISPREREMVEGAFAAQIGRALIEVINRTGDKK